MRAIGDKVKIKSTLEADGVYGEAYWFKEMNCYLGREATITSVLHDSGYTIDIDGNSQWEFTEEMLEEEEVKESDLSDLLTQSPTASA